MNTRSLSASAGGNGRAGFRRAGFLALVGRERTIRTRLFRARFFAADRRLGADFALPERDFDPGFFLILRSFALEVFLARGIAYPLGLI